MILSFRTSAKGINICLETLGRTRGGLFGTMSGLGFLIIIINFFYYSLFLFGGCWRGNRVPELMLQTMLAYGALDLHF